MVKIGNSSISNVAIGNKNIDLLNIGNKIIYAGYSYPCVGEYNLTPLLFSNTLSCLILETRKIFKQPYTFQNIQKVLNIELY